MSVTPKSPVQETARPANVSGPFVLPTTALDRVTGNTADYATENDVFRQVATVLPECGSGEFVAGYLIRDGMPARCPVGRWPPGSTAGNALDAEITALHGADGPIRLPGGGWGLAVGLRAFGQSHGYLVAAVCDTLGHEQLTMLHMVATQVAAAVAGITLRRRDQEQARQLRALHRKLAVVNQRLTDSMADLACRTSLHDALLQGSVSGTGEQRVAETLYHLTGVPVAVEDRFGNLRIWAGPGRPRPYPKPDAHRRAVDLHHAVRLGRPVRDRDRFLAVIQPGQEILGALVLATGRREITRQESAALECAATMLGVDLAHQRSLAEAELRLRRDLVADLLCGADPDGVPARCAAAGHDLAGPHHVALVSWRGVRTDQLVRAVGRGLGALRMDALTAPRDGLVVLVVAGSARPREVHEAVAAEVGSGTGTVAAGGLCQAPAELPRSFEEASRALEIRLTSRAPHGPIVFDNLGMYRLLDLSERGAHIERYVREWLGPLLEYDRKHDADLAHTLFQYLECGGNYADTAAALAIHRSTLRYRLQRIRDLTGLDLSEVDSRLNLHIASRAWLVLHGQTEYGQAE